jgi:two-component system sensor histidine kinase MprB
VGEVIAPVVDRVAQRTGRVVTLTADDSRVMVRPAALARAVSNLIDNAAKFDSSTASIEVVVDNGRVSVADRGPGVPAADRDRIFERFHRADTARTLPGSGLGLSIVAEVAIAHGGQVFAEDRDGGGAVIGLRLPLTSTWASPAADGDAHLS